MLSEQGAAGEAPQPHELTQLPGDEGGERRARLPALPAHVVWPLHGKGGAANCRWKHRGPQLGTFSGTMPGVTEEEYTSPECGAHR